MVFIKTAKEIEDLKESGKIARRAMDAAISAVKAGVTTLELNSIAEKVIKEAGASACFKGYESFPFATCINVGSGIVHGLPGNYRMRRGDVISIDLGVLYKGAITDLSETVEVESNAEAKFLETGKRALDAAISACRAGNTVGDISYAIQGIVEGAGYSVSRDLAGHGVGKEVHEDPFIPCYGRAGRGEKLVEGMTLAIEVIYQKGRSNLVLAKDRWTLSTKDGSLSGLFEKSVAVTGGFPLVLT